MSVKNSKPETINQRSLADETLAVPASQRAALSIFNLADAQRRLAELDANKPSGSLFSARLGATTLSLFTHAYKSNQRVIYRETNWRAGTEAVYDYLLAKTPAAIALQKSSQPIPYDFNQDRLSFNRFSAPALCYEQSLGQLTVHYGKDYADRFDSYLPESDRDDLAQQLVGQLALFDLSDRLAVSDISFRQAS